MFIAHSIDLWHISRFYNFFARNIPKRHYEVSFLILCLNKLKLILFLVILMGSNYKYLWYSAPSLCCYLCTKIPLLCRCSQPSTYLSYCLILFGIPTGFVTHKMSCSYRNLNGRYSHRPTMNKIVLYYYILLYKELVQLCFHSDKLVVDIKHHR